MLLRRIIKVFRHPIWAGRKVARLVFKESMPGDCLICGKPTLFYRAGRLPTETYTCRECGAISRNRHLAIILCRVMGVEEPVSLRSLMDTHPDLSIFEAQAKGAIHEVLQALPGYVCSEFFESVPPGSYSRKGVRCEDLERLTFEDNSFDIVITQTVFEHIRDPEAAWREIYRVLKPGGHHLFTIPYSPDRKTRRRVIATSEGDQYVLPKVYHGDGIRDGLVYTDFGSDLPDYLADFGLPTEVFSAAGLDNPPHHIYAGTVFVSRKES
jgi:SAM-dependent methyltransferase